MSGLLRDTDHRRMVDVLGIDVLDARIRQVVFLDGTQRDVVHDHLPSATSLEDVVVLGPVTLLKARFAPEDGAQRMTAELWFLPDGSRILELSTKASPAEAFQAAAETKVLLAAHGIDLAAPQETKTRAALATLVAVARRPWTP